MAVYDSVKRKDRYLARHSSSTQSLLFVCFPKVLLSASLFSVLFDSRNSKRRACGRTDTVIIAFALLLHSCKDESNTRAFIVCHCGIAGCVKVGGREVMDDACCLSCIMWLYPYVYCTVLLHPAHQNGDDDGDMGAAGCLPLLADLALFCIRDVPPTTGLNALPRYGRR